jgi:hypothetical protein
MFDVLRNICESNNFIVHDFDVDIDNVISMIAVPNENNFNQEYYLLLHCESVNDDFIEKLNNEYLEILMDKMEVLEYTDESLRKNSTLIISCKTEGISDQNLLKIEENPYFFKKNIITYDLEQLQDLKLVLNEDFTTSSINHYIMIDGGDKFEEFKTQKLKSNSYYPLLIKIITKIPFVHYLPQGNKLDNLETFVYDYLQPADIKLFEYISKIDNSLSNSAFLEMINLDWNEI